MVREELAGLQASGVSSWKVEAPSEPRMAGARPEAGLQAHSLAGLHALPCPVPA